MVGIEKWRSENLGVGDKRTQFGAEYLAALAIPKKFGSDLNSMEFPVAPLFTNSGRRLHGI